MDIQLQKAIDNFLKYTENYDLQNEHIKGKEEHSLRVMEISKKIAEKLNMTQEEVKVAVLIGLLHDIARFEQYTKYNTFKDLKSVDHGDLGAEILKKDIRAYIETDEYDEIIIKAVKNHNKFKIEEGLSNKEEVFARIIRDADKIDIFFESVEMFWKGKEQEVENSIISDDVLKQFKECNQIKRKAEESPIDNLMRVIAFIFDINFKESFQIIKNEKYINKIINRYNLKDEYTKKKVEDIIIMANQYVSEKI